MTAERSGQPDPSTRNTPARPAMPDWSVLVSIALMLAMVLVVAFGDAGPATAYAAVPM